MVLCYELTPYSLPEIGDAFERDHTTVLHALNRVRESDDLQIDVERCRSHVLRAIAGMGPMIEPNRAPRRVITTHRKQPA